MLPSVNRNESQKKTTAGSLKNSSLGLLNHIEAYWFIEHTIAEYCKAHGAGGTMNFRGGFKCSPGILKQMCLPNTIQQTVCSGFRQVLWLCLTSEDYWSCLGCTFTFPKATESSLKKPLYSCQWKLTGKTKIIYIFLKKADFLSFIVLRMQLLEYMMCIKSQNYFIT